MIDDGRLEEDTQQYRSSSMTWWRAIQDRRLKSTTLPGEHAAAAPSRDHHQQWTALLLGQAMALLMASMNASSYTLISRFNVQTQLFQMFFLYILLTAFLWRRRRPAEIAGTFSNSTTPEIYIMPVTRLQLRAPWWIYFLCSLLDILPNFLALQSLQYTSLTSATLLGSLTIPSTMLFARHLLGKTFRPIQYVGVCLCVIGGIMTVLSDSDSDQATITVASNTTASDMAASSSSLSHTFLGDAMAIAAAMCYGLGDTVAEYFVKHVEREEYLGMLGLYGMLFTGVSFPFLEHAALRQLFGDQSAATTLTQWCIAGVFTWYLASVYLFYTTEATFLIASDATLLNLHLQAANLWTILFSVLVDHHALPSGTFFVAAGLVVSGVFVYEVVQRSDRHKPEYWPTALAQDETMDDGEVEEVTLQNGRRRGTDDNDDTSCGIFRLPAIQISP